MDYNNDVVCEFLSGEDYDEDPSPDQDVEKSLRALKYWRKQSEGVSKKADAEIAKIQAWKEGNLDPIKKRIAWHEMVAFAHIQRTGEKTAKMVNGTIKKIAGRESVQISNEEELMAWAKEANRFDDVFKTEYKAKKTDILRIVKETGEEPLGVNIALGEDSFKVDV